MTGNQNLYGAATGETWDYYVRVTDEGGFIDSLYAAANGIGDYGNSFLTGIVYAEGGFLTGGTVKAQNVLTQGIGAKGSFGLSVDNTNVITALSNGNVGIGTTSPSYPLHVKSTESALIQIEGTTATNYTAIRYLGTGRTWSQGVGNGSETALGIANKFYLYDSNASAVRFVVDTSGNVGIGTTSPSNKLTVHQGGGVRVTGITDGSYIELSGDLPGYASNQYPVIKSGGTIHFANNGKYSAYIEGSNTYFGILDSTTTTRVFLATSGNTYFTGGNVGIGTTSPQRILELSQGEPYLRFNPTTVSAPYLLGAADGKFYFTPEATYVATMTLSSGNVGIGTASPTGALHVIGSAGRSTKIYYDMYLYNTLVLTDGNFNAQSGVGGTSGHLLLFSNGLTERMRITSGGNVGIGTTSPSSILQLGPGSYTATNSSYNTFNAGAFGVLFRDNYDAYLTFNTVYGASGWVNKYGSVKSAVINFNDGALDISTGTGTTAGGASNLSAKLTMTNAGNVGIGTTSPGGKLTVVGDGTEYSNIVFRHGANQEHLIYASTNVQYNLIGSSTPTWIWGQQSASERMRLNNTGLGIGTTSPESKLHINSSVSDGIIVRTTANVEPFIALQRNTGSNGVAVLREFDGGNLYIDTGATGAAQSTKMAITAAGNVGIGTTSPTQKLEVAGYGLFQSGVVGASGLSFYGDNSSATGMVLTTAGNVGIGTTSPAQKLHVEGIARLGGGTTDGALYVYSSNGTLNSLISGPGNTYLNATYGNVGIGTTSPQGPLEVYKANSGGLGGHIILNNNGLAVDNETAILFNDSGIGSVGSVRAAISSTVEGSPYYGNIKFKTGDGAYTDLYTRMTITGNGNVGIGTTSPQVVGAAWTTLEVQGKSTGGGGIVYTANNGASVKSHFYSDGNGGYIGTQTNNYFAFTSNNIERMRITSDGNVLIGTTTDAGYKLDVNGTTRLNGQIYLNDQVNVTSGYSVNFGTSRIHSTSSSYFMGGNVGIGTTSPGQMLHLARTGADNYIKIEAGGQAANYSGIMLTEAGINWGWTLRHNAADDNLYISYQDNTPTFTDTVTFKRNGNVGIGTASPAAPLHIYKSDTYSAIISRADWNVAETRLGLGAQYGVLGYISTGIVETINDTTYVALNYKNGLSTYAEGLRVYNNGNVGIGTTSPAYKLSVNESTTNPIAYFGLGPSNASSRNSLIVLQSGTIPQNGSDTTGEVGFLFKHSYGTGGVNGTANGGYIESIRESVFGITSQVNTALVFGTSASNTDNERMRITSSGNVGIGTTSPDYKLHVASTTNANIAISAASGYQTALELKGADQWYRLISQPSANGNRFDIYNQTLGAYAFSIAANTDVYLYGNVGIGTTTPNRKLSVNGIVGISSATANTQQLVLSVDSGASYITSSYFGTSSYVPMYLEAGGNVRLAILTNGNVGIGTTSPSQLLHLNAASGAVYTRVQNNINSLYLGLESGGIAQVSSDVSSLRVMANTFTSFETAGSERMRITSAGNVGIGTTSPSDGKLQVVSNSSNWGIYAWNQSANGLGLHIETNSYGTEQLLRLSSLSGAGGSNTVRMVVRADGNVGIGTASPATKLNLKEDNTGLEGFIVTNWNSVNTILAGSDPSTGGGKITLRNNAGTSNVFISSYGISHFNGGNVGIGTTSPGEKLTVNGAIGYQYGGTQTWHTYANSANSWELVRSGIATRMIVTSDGNVGIGTTSPTDILHVHKSGANTRMIVGNNAAYDQFIYFQGNNDWSIGIDNSNSNAFTISNYSTIGTNDRLTVTTGGNVGIGTTSPTIYGGKGMEVASSSGQTGIRVSNSGTGKVEIGADSSGGFIQTAVSGNALSFYTGNANPLVMRMTSSGNVLIGTTTDNGKKLQVNGDVFIKGSTSSSAYADSIFEVQNSNGTSIMDFRGDAYAFFGCGQGGGAASGFIFRYNDTSHVQFTGYNYGNGAGSYKPILLDTDLVGRSQGVYVNYGGTGYSYPAPISDAEFAVRGRTADATEKAARLDDSNGTEIFSVRNDGAVFTQGNQGWNGTVNFPTNAPGQQNLQFVNGILVNVF